MNFILMLERNNNMINEKIFREYDIRGIYNEDLDYDKAYIIGKSFGSYIDEKEVIIGYDNRLSSPILKSGLIKGLLETGTNVIDLGLVTTPMYYYAKKILKIKNGIMITASHNPKEYNGFKISFDLSGNAYGKYIYDFRDFTNKGKFINGIGTLKQYDIKEEYLNEIKESVNIGPRRIKCVFDCGNGTGSIIIKDIVSMFNIEPVFINCDSDGNFPNHHPDPSVKENMVELSKKVIDESADIGIGIDGDADRVGFVLNNGEYITIDKAMIIYYRNLELKEKRALYDVKCSRVLIDELEKLGFNHEMYRTGNSYMNMKINKENYEFAGEYSGHLWFKDKWLGFDDGIYAGLRMIEILSNKKCSILELLDNINKYYSTDEIKIQVTDENKFEIVEKVKEYCIKKGYKINDIDGVRVEMEDSWALIRCSNTGPNLTVRYESKYEEGLKKISHEFDTLINSLK